MQQHQNFLLKTLQSHDFKPGAAGSGSKYANHCAMLPPLFYYFILLTINNNWWAYWGLLNGLWRLFSNRIILKSLLDVSCRSHKSPSRGKSQFGRSPKISVSFICHLTTLNGDALRLFWAVCWVLDFAFKDRTVIDWQSRNFLSSVKKCAPGGIAQWIKNSPVTQAAGVWAHTRPRRIFSVQKKIKYVLLYPRVPHHVLSLSLLMALSHS